MRPALGPLDVAALEHEIAAMLGGNAAEFYGFDTEKLAPIVSRIGPEKDAFAG